MLKKIYEELVLIRKELQAIQKSKELSSDIVFKGRIISETARNTTQEDAPYTDAS